MANIIKFYKTNKIYFEEMAKGHDAKYYDSILRLINKSKINLKNKKILDIGCGSGTFAKVLKAKFGTMDFYGTDLSNLGEAYKYLKFKQSNAEKVPYKDMEFDIVSLTDVLEHTLKPVVVIKEATRVLKKGGFLILRLPNYTSPLINGFNLAEFFRDVYYYYFRKSKGLKNIAKLTPDLSTNGGGDTDAISGLRFGELLKELQNNGYEIKQSETWAGGYVFTSAVRILNLIPVANLAGSVITIIAKRRS